MGKCFKIYVQNQITVIKTLTPLGNGRLLYLEEGAMQVVVRDMAVVEPRLGRDHSRFAP